MNVRLLTLTAMIATLCALGALVKLPVGIGTAALDAVPALVSVMFLPPVFSGIAALIGHLVSALSAGMPFGPFHVLIAAEMFVILWVFGLLHRTGKNMWKWIFFVLANGVLAPLPFYFLIGPAFFYVAVPSLLIASCLNAGIAIMLAPLVKRVYKRVVVVK
ncbi:ECF transporter S component [Paenisporosarcina antarctica]|uniref:ECF transporter S component n=1 Tax=Paenisporosarcina antarctica TaxID=417367 RepID=A0A4V1ANA8_9BACL|nr:ECF transporter S component [Paenisporosarcina antarctica]QBP42125.1 ECF transporter S component [Paenisporosarcina antarctica]